LGGIESIVVERVRELGVEQGCGEVLVRAMGDTWSRTARRRGKQRQKDDAQPSASSSPLGLCWVGITVCLGEGLEVRFDWVRGVERGLFESFCAHVGRKVRGALGD